MLNSFKEWFRIKFNLLVTTIIFSILALDGILVKIGRYYYQDIFKPYDKSFFENYIVLLVLIVLFLLILLTLIAMLLTDDV